ncbi:MAG: hypothetical protein AAF288_14100 [Planctomycetota bacterium]
MDRTRSRFAALSHTARFGALALAVALAPALGCAGGQQRAKRGVSYQTGATELYTRGDLAQVGDQVAQALREQGLVRLTAEPIDNGQVVRAFTPGGRRVVALITNEPDGRLHIGVRVGTFGLEQRAAGYAANIADKLRG